MKDFQNQPFNLLKYSKVSIKHLGLSNDLVGFFQKVSMKRQGPSQKKLSTLFYFRAATVNFWTLLNNLVWIFRNRLYKKTSTTFFSNSRSLLRTTRSYNRELRVKLLFSIFFVDYTSHSVISYKSAWQTLDEISYQLQDSIQYELV